MTNDQLERLVIDRACGGMNEDMETLFETYLREHPECRETAAAWSALCHRCEKAFAGEAKPLRQTRRYSAGSALFMQRAAILLLAFLLGVGLERAGRNAQTTDGENRLAMEADIWPAAAQGAFWQEQAAAAMKPKQRTSNVENEASESFWGNYRKEFTHAENNRQ